MVWNLRIKVPNSGTNKVQIFSVYHQLRILQMLPALAAAVADPHVFTVFCVVK